MVVPRWAVHELRLTAEKTYANPYREAHVVAEFIDPSGASRMVRGFWDGENTFVIRLTPSAEGEWSYRTRSADPGLDGAAGVIHCVAPQAGARGFLRRDEQHRRHFVWDDGSRAFLFGTTYYNLLSNLIGGGTWQQALDGVASYGMNKARFKTCLVDGTTTGSSYPSTSPYGTTHDELNLDHFRALDEAVQYMYARAVIADLILFWNDDQNFGTVEQDERYLRYLIARYAAYPNVIFCLSNEWEYTGQPIAYWNRLGSIARTEDPWIAEGARLRALSIHQRTRIGWQFGDQDWPTHIILQYGVRNPGAQGVSPATTPRYEHGDQWGYQAIRFNWDYIKPIINDEYGYAGEPNDQSALRQDRAGGDAGEAPMTRDKHRHVMWGTYLAGGYGSTGDKYLHAAPLGRPYYSADWHAIAEYHDIKHLVDFFTADGVRFWELQPDHAQSSVEQRVYVLSQPGRCYIIYLAAGGRAALRLDGGAYRAVRFDPRTGDRADMGVTQAEVAVFETPEGLDWVIHVTGRTMEPDPKKTA